MINGTSIMAPNAGNDSLVDEEVKRVKNSLNQNHAVKINVLRDKSNASASKVEDNENFNDGDNEGAQGVRSELLLQAPSNRSRISGNEKRSTYSG